MIFEWRQSKSTALARDEADQQYAHPWRRFWRRIRKPLHQGAMKDEMPRRREVPFDPTERAPHGREVACAAAETDTAALMQSKPFEDPQPSRASLLPLRDVIEDALDAVLTPREAWIFNACVVERKSIRALAAELQLAKSYVDRIKHVACSKLRDALQHEPIVVEYLSRWDSEEMELAA